mmetsp:Transcript_91784/g.280869  ORF Transcript_91784/g.280869 Transcript_91784/m.280869 type:complete len:393 (+) Transcript_91784:1000-2178(+)
MAESLSCFVAPPSHRFLPAKCWARSMSNASPSRGPSSVCLPGSKPWAKNAADVSGATSKSSSELGLLALPASSSTATPPSEPLTSPSGLRASMPLARWNWISNKPLLVMPWPPAASAYPSLSTAGAAGWSCPASAPGNCVVGVLKPEVRDRQRWAAASNASLATDMPISCASQCHGIVRCATTSDVAALRTLLLTILSMCAASPTLPPPRPVQHTYTEWKYLLKLRRHAFNELAIASRGWNWSPPPKPMALSMRMGAFSATSASSTSGLSIPEACNAAMAIRLRRSTIAAWSDLQAYHFVEPCLPGTVWIAGLFDAMDDAITCIRLGSSTKPYPLSRDPRKQHTSGHMKMYGSCFAFKCCCTVAPPVPTVTCAASKNLEMSLRIGKQCGCVA